MITKIVDFEKKCTGCGACFNTCSNNAISMIYNKEGFSYPKIDANKCLKCNKCDGVCPIVQKGESENYLQQVYACQIKDKNMLLTATAGGFFPLLAKKIIDGGGFVYGCLWSNELKAVHKGSDNVDIIKKINGSKYVQSDMIDIFKEIYLNLKKGKTVLFSGTPCQVDAVKKYCKDIDLAKLITVDVICYGVPSPKLFSAYIEKLNKRHNAKVIDFKFRDKKTYGWSHTTVITLQRSDGFIFEIEEPDHNKIDYYKMFGTRNCFRESCYNCQYNVLERVSDFTTGNYWDIEKKSSSFKFELGVSMVLINTNKAKEIFNDIKSEMIVEERTIEDAILSNDALVKGSVYPKQRKDVYRHFEKKGFDSVYKKYYQENAMSKIKSKIKKIIKTIIRRK
ncbi:MAG: Coenzyme F420 hydrogenase/dehydrogenase, beta subunit C-terminal domain [Clostridia bacterium]|nr:Coenzyme F420 hydrogenase/dehydrogenase, beta subunit C-terminal domain [Clostridia bacterium]